MPSHRPDQPHAPPPWKITLAFAAVYVSWGTTYLAIKRGVQDEQLPPSLFSGTRLGLAGLLLLLFLAGCGQSLRLTRRDLARVSVGALLFFVGGNWLVALSQTTLPSGLAAVLTATTPLWMALLEAAIPGGDRLSGRGWLGLWLGFAGVACLLVPDGSAVSDWDRIGPGVGFVLLGALSWAVGTVVQRQGRSDCPHLVSAAYQMFLGGLALTLVGVAIGDVGRLPGEVTAGAFGAFVYLLVVGSLIGFLAFNYLLKHVPAAQVGTYAYVNPVIAVLMGWGIEGEELTWAMLAGMGAVLAGVAFVRNGGRGAAARTAPGVPAVRVATTGTAAAVPAPLPAGGAVSEV